MANVDEDWKKFLNSTQEDDEEVETVDTEDETTDTDEDEETDQDETTEDDEEGADEEESEEEDDSKADKGKNKKTDPETYKPRLKQFLNDDGSLNAQKIEDAYVESGKQAVKLNEKVETLNEQLGKTQTDYGALLDAIKAKPEIAEALFGKEGAKKLAEAPAQSNGKKEEVHPLLKHVEAQMNRQSKSEYEAFVKDHPEAATDPEKAKKIGRFMKIYGQDYREEHDGEIPPMKEALEAAYRFYGWDEEIKNKEDVATAAKKTAATRSSGTAKRSATKKEVTLSEQFFANKLGVKLKKS